MKTRFCLYVLVFLTPAICVASIEITEIMYDLPPPGADTGREWVEINNFGSESVNLTDWKFNDGSNHGLNEPPKNGGQGSLTISSGEYVILTGDATMFLSEHPGYSGSVIDTVMSLGQQDDKIYTLQIINLDGIVVNEVSYTISLGAKGDGTSLQKINGTWLASDPTPGKQNAELPAEESSQDGSNQEQQNASDYTKQEYVSPEDLPSVKAYAGKDKTMVSGALDAFRGEAYGFKNEPLENARYLWNLGDGTTKEGKNINHFYRYPGNYVVALYVSSGENTASDNMIVKVIANEIIISEVKNGADSFIEFQNSSRETINMSGWSFRSGKQKFTFSKNSFIGPGFFLTVPASSSGVLFPVNSGRVEILYPNRLVADTINYNGILKNGESFSRDVSSDGSYITKETPGEVNEDLPKQMTQVTANYKKPPVLSLIEEPKQAPRQNSGQAINIGATTEETIKDSENQKQVYQEANVVSATQKSGLGKWFYFSLVLALTSISGLGVFIVRRKGG